MDCTEAATREIWVCAVRARVALDCPLDVVSGILVSAVRTSVDELTAIELPRGIWVGAVSVRAAVETAVAVSSGISTAVTGTVTERLAVEVAEAVARGTTV